MNLTYEQSKRTLHIFNDQTELAAFLIRPEGASRVMKAFERVSLDKDLTSWDIKVLIEVLHSMRECS